MSRRSTAVLAGVLVLVVAVVAVVVLRSRAEDRAGFVAAAWLPVWEERGAASLADALDVGGVSEVSPTWATVDPDGGLTLTEPSSAVQDLLVEGDAVVIPVVQNFRDGAWQGQQIAAVLTDPEAAERHRTALVDAALEQGWDGVDIDYEELPPTAGPRFADFLAALADDLHAHDLVLSVAVPARSHDDDSGTLAYSYQAIGAAADTVRVMAYDHAWSGSEAGAVAPLWWVRDVVAYAVDRVPPEKLMLGLATYGYDWVDDEGVSLPAADAVALARRVDAEPRWDEESAASTFDYEEGGRQHTVWFEEARSLAAKQDVAVRAGLRGVVLWQLGGEDPDVWTVVGDATAGSDR